MNIAEFKQQAILGILHSDNLPQFNNVDDTAQYLGIKIKKDASNAELMKLGISAIGIVLNDFADSIVREFVRRNS